MNLKRLLSRSSRHEVSRSDDIPVSPNVSTDVAVLEAEVVASTTHDTTPVAIEVATNDVADGARDVTPGLTEGATGDTPQEAASTPSRWSRWRDKRRDKKATKKQWREHVAATTADTRILWVVFAALVVCVLNLFAVALWGMVDYGERVAQLPTRLAIAYAVGIEVFTIAAIAATFALRHAKLAERIFAWVVFGVPVVASSAIQVADGMARGLPDIALVSMGASPVLIALGTHLLAIVARSLDDAKARRAATTAGDTTEPDSDTDDDSVATPTSPSEAKKTATLPRQKGGKTTSKNDAAKRRAKSMARNGKKASEIRDALAADGCEVDRRTVHRWIQTLKETAQ